MVRHTGDKRTDNTLLTFLLGAVSMLILLGVIYIFTSQFSSATSQSELSSKNEVVKLETSSDQSSSGEEQQDQARTVENLSPQLVGESIAASDLSSDFTAQASSTYVSSKGNNYSASNVLDGDIETCWLEGSDGAGVGQTLTLTSIADDTLKIKTITIYSGFCADDTSWNTNYMPTQMSMSVDGQEVAILNLELSKEGQKFTLENPVDVQKNQKIVFTITKAESAGSNAYMDTAVTEISLAQ